ncbi:DUF2079 domain-containing protein [Kitasatospora atroaurantiaca]|uniref:Putative membrane protein DUF2079 n=1 Tax=Kitasatospora atroaurantiaca TaxID=285545 RepID=A0A561EN90_9ACTN|nr:DUF2079 domain-containing protein [Kitasatospora atroaurantiaca]TWE17074.1 putative membrane protein DUF2079 [Kitasatospora atroaurantiaca]
MTTTPASPALPRPRWARPPGAPAQQLWRPATAPHLALAALFLAAYTLIAVLRYQRFGSPSYDLGIFTEAVKAYAHLRAPIVPIKGEGFNLLGDHFSPILALLAPAFRLFPTPVTLLFAQACLFAWSTGIVSDTAARLLGRNRGLCIGAAYGLSFGLQRAADAEFHEIAFAVPLLAISCRQLLLRRWHRAAWWALPLLLVKEDLGLTVATVGVLLLWQGRRWWTGTILLAAGLAGTAAAVWWLIPHFNPQHHFDYWSKAPHHGWWQAIWQPLSRLEAWKTVAWTTGITGLLALRSPLAVLAAPTLVWRLTSTNEAFWGTGWHYSAPLMPIAFLAAADAADRLGQTSRPWLRQLADRTVTALPAVALACSAGMTYGVGDLARADAWSSGPRAATMRDALHLVPDGVRVESVNSTLASLAARTDTYWVGGSKTRPPDYLLLDLQGWGDGIKDPAAYGAQLHPGATYELLLNRDHVAVLRLQP